jgi:ribosomal protein S18 acetylase RimI-like enzyme
MASGVPRSKGMEFRRLSARDLDAAHGLSSAVQWPHRREDWQFVYELGCGFAAVEGDDTVVGTALWWPYGDGFATIGMVIVSPDRQGAGIGRRLMDAVLADAGPRAVQLNATAEGIRLYEATGFEPIGSIRQHQGVALERLPKPAACRGMVRPMVAEDRAAVERMDRSAAGVPRTALLDALARVGEGFVLERDDILAGFAFMRRFGRGRVIGPVIAPDAAAALTLISTLVTSTGGFVRVDIPADAEDLVQWLEGAALPRVGTVTTMIRGVRPVGDGGMRLFGLANQALG